MPIKLGSGGGGAAAAPVTITAAGSGDALGDALFGNVKLLLKFEGANNSQSIVDSSRYGRDVVAHYASKISTGHIIAGTSSGYTDGTNDVFSVGGQAFNFVSKELCFEFAFNTTASAQYATLMAHERYAGIGGSSWLILLNNAANDGKVGFWFSPYNTGAPMLLSALGGYNDGNDHYVAVTRKNISGASFRWDLWLDGVSVANITDSANFTTDALSGSITIGGDPVYGRNVAGYYDLVRITSDHYRYDHPGGAFTPPTDMPAFAGQIMGTITNTSVVTDFRVVAVDAATGSEVGSTTTSTNSFTIDCDDAVPCIVTIYPQDSGDYVAAPPYTFESLVTPS
jgi:hypothetical protein